MGLAQNLPASPMSPALARRCLSSLEDSLPLGRLGDLQLLVSEVVTNAVVHSGLTAADSVELTLEVLPDRVRMEVTDGGRGFGRQPAPAGPGEEAGGPGFGLLILDHLADRWGIERGTETMVWAELYRGPGQGSGWTGPWVRPG